MLRIAHTLVQLSFYVALMSLFCSCRHMPSHASREVLIVLGSLATCDPGDIGETIKVRCCYCVLTLPGQVKNGAI